MTAHFDASGGLANRGAPLSSGTETSYQRIAPVLPPPKRMQLAPVSQVKRLRWALALTQEEFSTRYGVPLDLLLAWEKGDMCPDASATAFLTAIEADPQAANYFTR